MTQYIDKILYINLDHRLDKKTSIEAELTAYGLIDKTERFPGYSHSNTAYGCSMAHLAALKYAKRMGFTNVLILEDDFTFIVSPEVLERNLHKLMESQIEYDVVFLSYNIRKSEPTQYDFISRALYSQTASGYLVRGEYLDTIIELYEKSFPMLLATGQHWNYMNDVIWKSLQMRDNWYYFYERIGKQRACINDNGAKMTNYEV